MQKETQVIRWVDHKEEKVPECRNNRSHSDPTANEAIGNVMREERRKEKEKMLKELLPPKQLEFDRLFKAGNRPELKDMNTQDIRKEQEQVLAHAAERPSELFGLLDYIFDHANGDVDEAETRILDEIKRWVRDMCKMIAGKKVQLKKLKEQLLSAPTLTPVEAYYAMNSGCSGEGERVQSSHISDPTAKAAIGALDYIIRTWRDDYKKSLKKYGTLAGDIYLLEMAADYVGGEQGTVVRQIYVDGVFWKDAVGLEGKSLSWQVIRKMERQAQEEMAEFILKYWKTQREENEEDMKDGTEKVV